MSTTTTLDQAVATYLARRSRRAHPAGTFDNGGRWFANDAEVRPCCRVIRTPSRAYPFSEMTHCRTIEHVAHLYDVDVRALRRAIRDARVTTTTGA